MRLRGPMDHHIYEAAIEVFLEDATPRKIEWLLIKHLEWRRLRTQVSVRVRAIINKQIRELQLDYYDSLGLEPPSQPAPLEFPVRARSRRYVS